MNILERHIKKMIDINCVIPYDVFEKKYIVMKELILSYSWSNPPPYVVHESINLEGTPLSDLGEAYYNLNEFNELISIMDSELFTTPYVSHESINLEGTPLSDLNEAYCNQFNNYNLAHKIAVSIIEKYYFDYLFRPGGKKYMEAKTRFESGNYEV